MRAYRKENGGILRVNSPERGEPVARLVSAWAAAALVFLFLAFSPSTACAAPFTWDRLNANGFGVVPPANNQSAFSMAVFENKLYVGTQQPPPGSGGTGCEIWSYDGPGATDWTRVGTGGFGDANNRTASCMAVWGGKLYVGTVNHAAGCEVWRFDGGTSWARVGSGGLGDSGNSTAGIMAVHNGKLYLGTGFESARVFRYEGGTSWIQVNADGFSDPDNTACRSLASHQGMLYAGTQNRADGFAAFRYDGASWSQVAWGGISGGADSKEARVLLPWRNRLYLGSSNSAWGCGVWRYEGGTKWSRVDPGGGTLKFDTVRCMVEYIDQLFIATGNESGSPSGSQVWRYDGDTWEQMNRNGFGDAGVRASHSMAILGERLCVGTADSAEGCKVWRNRFPRLEVVKSAPPTAAPGETFAYTVTIANRGTADAEGVAFSDSIPPHTSVVAGSVTCSDGNADIKGEDPLLITGITVKVGREVTIGFSVNVSRETPPGTVIANQGHASYMSCTVPSSDPAHPGEGTPTEVTVRKPPGSRRWLVAEGSTGGGFNTWILLQNPNGEKAAPRVTFITEDGPGKPFTVHMAPSSRSTLRVSDYLPGTWGVSTMVESDLPVVVERSLYWDRRYLGESGLEGEPPPYEMKGGHSNLGVPLDEQVFAGGSISGGRSNYFPEGSTAGGFDTWILMVNPNPRETIARVSLMTSKGVARVDYITVPAYARRTLHLDEYLPDAAEVATEVYTNDVTLVTERSMYWDPESEKLEAFQMRGGHSNAGSTSPAHNWFLPEGSTGGGFETYILVQNPGQKEANLTVAWTDEDGFEDRIEKTMAPRSRATFRVSDYVPDEFQVSTFVQADVPVVAERSMYWDRRSASQTYEMRDGHSTVGARAPGRVWFIPEGSTGGGFDSYVLVSNTLAREVKVTLSFMTAEGVLKPVTVAIPAKARFTFRISDCLPGEFQVSTTLVADGEVVAERSMYWDKRQGSPHGEFEIRPYEMMGGSSSSALDP